MSRRFLVRLGVVGAAMTFTSGCGGAAPQLRPQPRPDPSPGYDVTAAFDARSGLDVGAKVTLEDATAGRVTHVEANGSQLIATLRIRASFAPLDVDTQAVARPRSSASERPYVALIPGHHGTPLGDEARLRGGPIT